jgi:hypothetical protein
MLLAAALSTASDGAGARDMFLDAKAIHMDAMAQKIDAPFHVCRSRTLSDEDMSRVSLTQPNDPRGDGQPKKPKATRLHALSASYITKTSPQMEQARTS